MAKISIALFLAEASDYRQLLQLCSRYEDLKPFAFGSYMNDKYKLDDEALSKEGNFEKAYAIIQKKYLQK